MSAAPPTVVCPGCGQAVEVAHVPARGFDGGVIYKIAEHEVETLLRHWSQCPNVEPAAARSAVTCPGCGEDVAVEHVRDRGFTSCASIYLDLRPDDSALLEHWQVCPDTASAS